MPRKYKPKPGVKKRQFEYPQLEEAKEAIANGSLSFKEASLHFKIPKTTLHDKIKGKYKTNKPGRLFALGEETEASIVNFLEITSSWGFPQNTQDLVNFVKHFLISNDIKGTLNHLLNYTSF
jgi:hypothetical protein